MAAPLLYADGRADVAEHLRRAIEAICADDPPHVRASAEKRANEAAYPLVISERSATGHAQMSREGKAIQPTS
jgi:hypothetical protein